MDYGALFRAATWDGKAAATTKKFVIGHLPFAIFYSLDFGSQNDK
jgi:hypothetical protein